MMRTKWYFMNEQTAEFSKAPAFNPKRQTNAEVFLS